MKTTPHQKSTRRASMTPQKANVLQFFKIKLIFVKWHKNYYYNYLQVIFVEFDNFVIIFKSIWLLKSRLFGSFVGWFISLLICKFNCRTNEDIQGSRWYFPVSYNQCVLQVFCNYYLQVFVVLNNFDGFGIHKNYRGTLPSKISWQFLNYRAWDGAVFVTVVWSVCGSSKIIYYLNSLICIMNTSTMSNYVKKLNSIGTCHHALHDRRVLRNSLQNRKGCMSVQEPGTKNNIKCWYYLDKHWIQMIPHLRGHLLNKSFRSWTIRIWRLNRCSGFQDLFPDDELRDTLGQIHF